MSSPLVAILAEAHRKAVRLSCQHTGADGEGLDVVVRRRRWRGGRLNKMLVQLDVAFCIVAPRERAVHPQIEGRRSC